MIPSIWCTQPYKTIYIAFVLLIKTPALLFFSLRYCFQTFRPLPNLPFRINLFVRLVRELLLYQVHTRSTDKRAVEASQLKANEHLARVPPGDERLYKGALAADASVKPATVGGLWYLSPPKTLEDLRNEKVVVHFPGGAFVIALGSDFNGWMLCRFVMQDFKATRLFLAQYRVAEDHSSRFPAALQDLVTFYNYIVSLRYSPQNIILSGDSAAGNLTIGLVRYLEQQQVLAPPMGAILWSPWVHVTNTAGGDYRKQANIDADILVSEMLQWGAEAHMPEEGPSSKVVAYISPLHHPFKTPIPFFIHVRGIEGLYESTQAFAQEMSEVKENRVKLHVTDLAPHNSIFSHLATGLTSEMQKAFGDAREFFFGKT